MKNRVTRRRFLASTGTAALATLFWEAVPLQAAVPLVRRDVGKMDASDPILVAYGNAIQKMQALPNNNPLSWAYQAAIHGTQLTPPLTAWNTCEHGTEFFWSWHRMYLYWFERIVRKMCNEPCWALPYWDWAPGSELQLPAPFRVTTSPLFTPNRNPAMNDGTGSLNPLAVSIGSAFSNTDFVTTNLTIQDPHGNVHGGVGGWMCCVPTAAQDPIFYVHHANVDRQWNLWLAQGGGRVDPLGDTTWKNRQYTFFDENGAQVNMTACQILRAAQQLNYVYECEPPQVREYCLRIFPPPWLYETELLLPVPIPPVELRSQPVTFPIELKALAERIAAMAESKTDTILLEFSGVEADNPPEATWAVFVDRPAGAELNAKSPSFVGSFSLFGVGIRSEKHHEFRPGRFLFPLNRALQAGLKAEKGRITVTVEPIGILINGKPSRPEVKSPVRIGKINLLVQHRKPGPKEGSEKQR